MSVDLASLGKQATLREAVAELRRRGMSDPVQATAYLSETYGEQWLLRQLVSVVAGLIATSTEIRPGVVRTIGLPRVERASGGFLESKRWVSAEVGWRAVEDLTAADCRAIADQYRLLSEVALRHSRWFSEAARTLDERGATTLAEIADDLLPLADLPALALEATT